MSTLEAPARQLTSDELIINNMGLVGSAAKRVNQTTGADYLELFQEGSIGLIKAARSFKVDMGFKFATYANRCIVNQMLDYLNKGKQSIQCISLETVPHWYERAGEYAADLSRVEVDMAAIQSMTAKQKHLISLLCSGYSQRQAAAEMGLTTGSVQRLIKRLE